eukprot:CAMPEP_0204900622 /NCGR_PEP_ID=MMETSP1397-20131031/2581_1 /ASSEMBLY_ACC=CAM_ASM_000891 /TAXON_ID=49980 /ORGANISM="Climacostomum Climacostomum virens, Strain Stock W-24" /LENGTH=409 /DNA_ID=CAMNT_0052068803 /DNA_START=171 /DNA_END=1400 /DNA_ORIENTATION=-
MIVKELLRRGADPNRLNKYGEAPLHQAVNVSEDVVTALLDSGAQIDIRQFDGETPLHLAATKGRTEMVKLLLKRKATVDLPNFLYGKTALHFAVEGGYEDTVKLLLQFGACVDLKDKNGLTPLDCADTSTMKQILICSPLTPPKPQILIRSKYHMKPSSFRMLDLEEGTQATDSYLKTIDPEPTAIMNSAQQITCDSETFKFNPSNDVSGAFSSRGAKDLLSWLNRNRLEEVYKVLVENGYDDLEMLQETQKSEVPLTKEMLRSIGIIKPGLAARLLGLLELENYIADPEDFRETDKLNCCGKPVVGSSARPPPTLYEWLERMGLGHLQENFESAGYDDFEHLVLLNKTSQKITDEVLYRELGIKMMGHRHRILFKLMEDSRSSSLQSSFVSRVEAEQRCAPCKNCLLS